VGLIGNFKICLASLFCFAAQNSNLMPTFGRGFIPGCLASIWIRPPAAAGYYSSALAVLPQILAADDFDVAAFTPAYPIGAFIFDAGELQNGKPSVDVTGFIENLWRQIEWAGGVQSFKNPFYASAATAPKKRRRRAPRSQSKGPRWPGAYFPTPEGRIRRVPQRPNHDPRRPGRLQLSKVLT
jgi:hypothetical protein